MESSAASVSEAAQHLGCRNRGGWITFPFTIATMAGLSLSGGWVINLIAYLKHEFQFQDIAATKVYNYVNGSITMFPFVGAIIADSFVGSFSVIWFSSLISLLGILLLILTSSINHFKPPTCEKGSNLCRYPSHVQLFILYLGLVLASLGTSGTRFTIASMGANQFDNPKHQGIFFNWYTFSMYMANIISATATVYIEETVTWIGGLSLCAAANVIGLVVFVSGRRFYRVVERKGSPFKSLACVVLAAISKRKMMLSTESEDYYHDDFHADGIQTKANKVPTDFFRFLNHAALRTEPDTPWKQCTVQQVEDLKILIKIFPLWLSGSILSIPIAIQMSFIIFQAKNMNRNLGSLKMPPASMQVFTLISTTITISILDRLLFPLWEKLFQKPLTPLQRVGIGHFFTILSMAISAIMESKRLKLEKRENLIDDVFTMSVFWIAPQLVVIGVAEAFHFAGQIAFYYQEFPETMKSISTAAVAMSIGTAFYLSNVVIDVVRRGTEWLPEDVNDGRLDNLYWLCCVVGVLNWACYLVCASLYKYRKC